MSDMAILKTKLPPHCQIKDRGRYADIYFTVHPKDRPEGWLATIHLGRTDRLRPEEIEARAMEVYEDYLKFRAGMGQSCQKPGTLPFIIQLYKKHHQYLDMTPRTQIDYGRYLKEIEDWSVKNHHPHIKLLSTPQAVKFLNAYEAVPLKQQRMKNILSTLCRVAIEDGFIERNPIKDVKLRKRTTKPRAIHIWTEADVLAFIAKADEMGWPSIGTALLIAYEIGQRQGDVLRFQKPRDYREGKFVFSQSKTGKDVRISATARLRLRLDGSTADSLLLVSHDNTKRLWDRSLFAHTFRDIANEAGLPDHIFQQARHSAINNLERAGCSISQIAAVTGHSRKTVQAMLDNHYGIDRDEEMANKAITNLENYRKVRQKKSDGSHTKNG